MVPLNLTYNVSTLFTSFFLWTALQFILYSLCFLMNHTYQSDWVIVRCLHGAKQIECSLSLFTITIHKHRAISQMISYQSKEIRRGAYTCTYSLWHIYLPHKLNRMEIVVGLPFTASQYCFGKVFPVWSFPAFYFMHANGDGNQSSFGRFRYYYVNYRTNLNTSDSGLHYAMM